MSGKPPPSAKSISTIIYLDCLEDFCLDLGLRRVGGLVERCRVHKVKRNVHIAGEELSHFLHTN